MPRMYLDSFPMRRSWYILFLTFSSSSISCNLKQITATIGLLFFENLLSTDWDFSPSPATLSLSNLFHVTKLLCHSAHHWQWEDSNTVWFLVCQPKGNHVHRGMCFQLFKWPNSQSSDNTL